MTAGRHRVRVAGLCLAATAYLAAGCQSGNGTTIALPDHGGGARSSDDAQIEGVVRIDVQADAPCVWLEEGGLAYQALWPEGFRLRIDDPVAVLDGRGRVVAEEGQRLVAAGGYRPVGEGPGCPTDAVETVRIGRIESSG